MENCVTKREAARILGIRPYQLEYIVDRAAAVEVPRVGPYRVYDEATLEKLRAYLEARKKHGKPGPRPAA